MPKVSLSIFTIGARQFVVQDALLTNLCSGLSVSWLTPMTMVASMSPFAGALRSTFLAPAWMCLPMPSASRKMPVLSTTSSTPASPHPSLLGSLSAVISMALPFTTRLLPSTSTVPGNARCTESYLKRVARLSMSRRSLILTTSNLSLPCMALKTSLPIRPKPLMPTLTAIACSFRVLQVLSNCVFFPRRA